MKAILSLVCIALAGVASSLSAAEITLNELRRNPLWLPPTTTLKKDLSFTDGTTLRAGQALDVRAIERNQVVLASQADNMTFNVDPAATTLLADATARVSAFTPEQKQLTPATLRSRRDLWPYMVTFRDKKEFNDGTVFEVGTKLPLAEFDGRQVKLIEPEKYITYTFSAETTDFYDACLQAVLSPGPSRVYQELAGVLSAGDSTQTVDLLGENAPEFLVIYHAADWCPYCAQTSPDVISWYRELKEAGDKRFQLVIISNDKSPEEFRRHLGKFGPAAVATPPEISPKLFVLNQTTGVRSRSLPDFYVIDRAGKVVIPAANGMPVDRVRAVLDRTKTL